MTLVNRKILWGATIVVYAEGIPLQNKSLYETVIRSASAEFGCIDRIYEANVLDGRIRDNIGGLEEFINRLEEELEIVIIGADRKAQDTYDLLMAHGIDICGFVMQNKRNEMLLGRKIMCIEEAMGNLEHPVFLNYTDVHGALGEEWTEYFDYKEERDAYYHALCLAKYIFFTDAYGFARNCRSDQIRVQLWHGCGFKTRVNFVRCENCYEYTTVISELYSKIHQDIYGLRENQMLVTGYAKQDWLFSGLENEKWDWLQIPKDNKCIFWLPTFRTATEGLSIFSEERETSETGLPIVDTMEKLMELNRILENTHIMLLVKLHPFQNKSDIYCEGLSHVKLLNNHELYVRDIQVNQLLSRADALISDYSFAEVDYMLLDRPIAFTLDDVEEYAVGRGFVFDPIEVWLPGELIYNFDEFTKFVDRIAAGEDTSREKRRRLTEKMHKFHDGNSCKRIVEALGIRNKNRRT